MTVREPSPSVRAALASLPQIDRVLQHDALAAAIAEHGRERVLEAVRRAVDEARTAVRGGAPPPSAGSIASTARARLSTSADHDVRPVLNATGVVIHTNLGRAPLSEAAQEAIGRAAGYATVEYDLETGSRGSRTANVGDLAAAACGAEAATVVNNGAAALLLVLAALSSDREVVVSRGELIEIGGSFRLPDVMQMSGARMVEVGTTNRTHLEDYRSPIGEQTGLLLKVHRSNFRQVGFTRDVSARELADLARETQVPFVYDVGSGLVADSGPLHEVLVDEPSVRAALRDGADLVVFSGDKVLGGPQAGIIAGRAELVAACRSHPLMRALRVDKLQRAALEATLRAYLRSPEPAEIPTVAMLTTDPGALAERAEALLELLSPSTTRGDGTGTAAVELVELRSVVGGGAAPTVELPSIGLAISGPDPDVLAATLRTARTPVIARIEKDRVVLDLRTVPRSSDPELADALQAALYPGAA